MPHFKAKKRLSDGANGNANRARDSLGSKCNAAADAATPDSPDVITGPLPPHAHVRGRGGVTDVTPRLTTPRWNGAP